MLPSCPHSYYIHAEAIFTDTHAGAKEACTSHELDMSGWKHTKSFMEHREIAAYTKQKFPISLKNYLPLHRALDSGPVLVHKCLIDADLLERCSIDAVISRPSC